MTTEFDEFLKHLGYVGFKLISREEYSSKTNVVLKLKGHGLQIYMFENPIYESGNQRIFIDREDCFDKFSKCPIKIPVPVNLAQANELLRKMEWLTTEEGFVASNEYEHEKWMNDFTATDEPDTVSIVWNEAKYGMLQCLESEENNPNVVDEVGRICYCYACGRKAFLPSWATEGDENEGMRCICCERPFNCCPCSPVEDGQCTSEIS